MAEKFKAIKLNVTLAAILTVILGIVLIAWPGETLIYAAKIIAAFIVLAGIFQLIHALCGTMYKIAGSILSLILILLGIWLFTSPDIIVSLIPVVIGVLLIVHGVQDFSLAIETKKYKGDRWWLGLLLGILSIVGGLFCIANAFGLVTIATVITGIMLIYDGLSDMLIVHKVNKASKYVDSQILREEDVDDLV